MASMAGVLGLIFSDMHDMTITELTKMRTTGSVPYGARYRLIDFPLSNMANSGISQIGVVTKSNYQSLLDHLGAGGEWDLSRKTGGLQLLPPYGQANISGLYKGRLDALSGIAHYIVKAKAEYVIMSDADVIAAMDYQEILDYHISKGADITIVYGKGEYEEERLKTKTVLRVNDDGQVYEVLVRPETSGSFNVSLNAYVIRKDLLLQLVREGAAKNIYSFENDVIQARCKEFKICGYRFNNYFAQIDSMMTYFRANMELLNSNVRTALFNADNPIYTKVRDDAPAKYEIGAKVNNSIVADGCIIEGEVSNCVLFRGVKIGKGAVVRNAVVMQDTVVGEKCELNYVIIDKDAKIGSFRSLFGTESYPVFVGKGANV
ncbi:glucose-1-phosphate adenylyltransferase subunit GlgD [Clostridia bacterium]|nr:glucose-1-phosphate adenylyltransferase subunit GlgD [Clostridia bacterium]